MTGLRLSAQRGYTVGVLAFAVLLLAPIANAATMTFDDRGMFEATTSGTVQDFNTTVIPAGSASFSFMSPDFTATQTTPNPGVQTNAFVNSRNPDFSAGDRRLGVADRPGNLLIFDAFQPGTTAFGLDIFSDTDGLLEIGVTTAAGTTLTQFAVTALTRSTGVFFGVTDTDGILSVALDFPDIVAPRRFSLPTVDDVFVGQATPGVVPLPAGLPLLLAGLMALGLLARRNV